MFSKKGINNKNINAAKHYINNVTVLPYKCLGFSTQKST